jgi:dihydroorotase
MATATTQIPLLITGGRVIDPSQSRDVVADVLVEKGRIAWVWEHGRGERPSLPARHRVIDARGLAVAPGFIDLHCHLREPGLEHKETIATGTRAAAKGGFTTVCAMPNTEPAVDTPGLVEFVRQRAQETGVVRVLPIAAVTLGRRGQALAELEELAEAGAIGFSDDGAAVHDPHLMRNALSIARALGLPIIQHCEDPTIVKEAVAQEGWVATRLGLPAAPALAETTLAARDVALAAVSGGWLHLAHISAADTIEHVRRAKEQGIRVTAEVTPHHLALTHEALLGDLGLASWPRGRTYDTSLRINPPLRRPEDVAALAEALREGTIDIIATDHAPHAWEDKAVPFAEAAPGMSGLETAFGLLMTALVHRGLLGLPTLVHCLSTAPAALLPPSYRDQGLGSLREGATADIVLLDPERTWTVRAQEFASKGKNTPLDGCGMRGQAVGTLAAGEIAHAVNGLALQEVSL